MSNSIRKWIFVLIVPLVVVGVISSAGGGAGHGVALQDANVNLSDKASLQRGAKYYANYCAGCHSLKFSRYNRVAQDIGLNAENGFTEDDAAKLMAENLIFTRDEDGKVEKVGSLMKTAYSTKAATEAFGTAVPDLSLVGRSRGSDWIYSYLKGFYLDDSRPMGVNNTVFKDVGMPHVLADLQGYQTLDHHDGDDHGAPKLTLSKPGKLSAAEYDVVVHDLTNYLAYIGEPAQLTRGFYGILTLIFLMFFLVVAVMLEKEYWKDIH